MYNETVQTILNEKIIVIVRGVEKEKLLSLTQAMCDGGIRLLELTYSADGSVSDEENAENIRMLADAFAGRMLIGAGTVLTEKQAELTKEAGGKFIISPDVNCDVIRRTKKLGMVSIPGALTPTEVTMADRAGADFIKLFPVTAMGPDYLKAIRAPLSHIKFLAVGGLSEKNIPDYMNAGALGIGISSNIVDKKLLAAGDYAGITALAKKYAEIVKA